MDLEERAKTAQFLWRFHFLPAKRRSNDPVIRQIAQASVDKKLAELAWKFLREGRLEKSFQRQYDRHGYKRHSEFPVEPGGDEFEYIQTKRHVRQDKVRFWKALKLARWAGFKVRRKVTDYLDQDLLLYWQLKEAGYYN